MWMDVECYNGRKLLPIMKKQLMRRERERVRERERERITAGHISVKSLISDDFCLDSSA